MPALAGLGTAWLADWGDSELTHLSSSGQELSGSPHSSTQLFDLFTVATDASGILWVSNKDNNTLTEFIGMAAPVRTPRLALRCALTGSVQEAVKPSLDGLICRD